MARQKPQKLQDFEQKLKQNKPLSELLLPKDFAEENGIADLIAKEYKDKLNPTQMRKVFHTVKAFQRNLRGKNPREPLDGEVRTQLILLKPNLAYAVGRNNTLPKDVYDILKLCINDQKLKTVADFNSLVDFLTAVLAYQKFRKSA